MSSFAASVRKKSFWHKQETNTPPRNCQVCHIGCICVLIDAPLERPNPRVLMSNILTIIATTKGLKNAGPNNKTLESYTRKASPPHLQADKHTSEHSHRRTNSGAFFFGMRSCEYSTNTYTHPSERIYTF